MRQLLDKKYQQRVDILSYLELEPLQKAFFKDIGSNLFLSSYVIKKEIPKIIEDFELFQINGLKLVIEDKMVYFYSNGENSLLELQWHYLKESELFLFLDSILKIENLSLEDFATDNYLSVSSAYLTKIELEKILTPYKIKIDANLNFIGDEIRIRTFLYDVYFYTFNSLELPFSKEIIDLSNHLIRQIDKVYSRKLGPTQTTKLRFFFAILFQRLYTGYTISVDRSVIEIEDTKPSKELQFIKKWFVKQTTLKPEEITQEVHFIYSFLLAEQLITNSEHTTMVKHIKAFCPKASHLTNSLLKMLNKVMGIDHSTPNYLDLKGDLLEVHFKFLYFNHTEAAFTFDFDFSFFKENYPDFFLFIESFIASQNLGPGKTNTLKYDYLFLLIQYVPATVFSKPIYICVDFSYGSTYNSFISDNINSFKFLNIVIEDSYSDNTDLYLSDLKSDKLTCDSIIWKKPPLSTDWENFGNKIVELKESGGTLYGEG